MISKVEENQYSVFDAGYKFKLTNFEGPLDLLLHLIKESKMEIFDIKISQITEQYLLYMDTIDQLDMEKASDFIEMAATLIEIKSKQMLPKEVPENPDEEDDEAMLLRRLKEYKLFKEISEKIQEVENVNRFYKQPDDSVNDYRVILQNMEINGLLNAFADVLTRITVEEKKLEPKKIQKDRWTVAEKIVAIKQRVLTDKRVKFTQLFDENYTKGEVINIFLALLELLKIGCVKVDQKDTYTDIDIIANEEYKGDENIE